MYINVITVHCKKEINVLLKKYKGIFICTSITLRG